MPQGPRIVTNGMHAEKRGPSLKEGKACHILDT